MKKKMLILIPVLRPGGVERATLNFIRHMKDHFEIELLLLNKDGTWMNKLPDEIRVVNFSDDFKNFFTNDGSARYPVKNIISSIIKKSVVRFYHVTGIFKCKFNKIINKLPKIEENYDLVICSTGAYYPLTEIALEKINANKKFVFYHEDITRVYVPRYIKKNIFKFDKIFCVSASISKKMQEKFKRYKDKIDYQYNFLDTEKIKEESKGEKVTLSKNFNFVSVSRISPEKAITRSIKVFGKLKNKGYNFHWTIIGDGPDLGKCKKLVKKLNLTAEITFLGSKSNPYAYIKAADMLLLLSYFESFGIVIAEAFTLGTPVLATKMISSKEVVGEHGIICDNNSKGIYKALKMILTDKLKINLENYEYPNDTRFEQ